MVEKTISFPNELFFKEVKTLLDEDKQVRIPVKGRSMRPFLQDGDTVILDPVRDRSVRWGMIVLARTTTCGVVLHRVVFKSKDKLWLMGDALSRKREQTVVKEVLAVVVAAQRKGEKRELNSYGWRSVAILWFLILPLRENLLRIYDKLNQKK